jgi:hypothetical protein
MANPRAAVGHLDVRTVRKSFKHDATIVYDAKVANNSEQAGRAVTLTGEAADTVSLVGDGEKVTGRLEIVEADGFCTVTTHGHVELPGGTGATLTQGLAVVGDLGGVSTTDEGYVRAIAPATLADVAAGRGEIINPSTPAKTVVRLD